MTDKPEVFERAGPRGGSYGDLFLQIHVHRIPSRRFHREPDDSGPLLCGDLEVAVVTLASFVPSTRDRDGIELRLSRNEMPEAFDVSGLARVLGLQGERCRHYMGFSGKYSTSLVRSFSLIRGNPS